ncbi:MAG: alpha/beta hydrolase fold domain-containing protein [Bacteroidales bacterium]
MKTKVQIKLIIFSLFISISMMGQAPTTLPTFKDVSYGPYKEQILDFWKPESTTSTPVIISIHGGGWLHGPIDPFKAFDQYFLDKKVAIVHITYRFTSEYPLPAPVYDAARAVQFVRYKAKEWNIDPKKIVVTGFSAGGCSSLLLATGEDMANPKSKDPVERESSSVLAVSAIAAQTTLMPDEVLEWVGQKALNHPMNCRAGGFKNNEEMLEAMKQEKVKKLYKDFSPIHRLSTKTVPVLLEYAPLAPVGEGDIHGAAYGIKFKEKADQLGLRSCYLKINKSEQYTGYPGGRIAFIESIFSATNKGVK